MAFHINLEWVDNRITIQLKVFVLGLDSYIDGYVCLARLLIVLKHGSIADSHHSNMADSQVVTIVPASRIRSIATVASNSNRPLTASMGR